MSHAVITTIKEYLWVVALIGLIIGILNAYFGGGWGRSGISWTFALTRTQQLKSLRKQQARLKHLHDTGGVSGCLLSGILWVLFLFGVQLTPEGSVASPPAMSSPQVQALWRELLHPARFTVGYIIMVVSINRLTWYRRLEHYDTAMARLDRAIARLEAKLAGQQPAAAT